MKSSSPVGTPAMALCVSCPATAMMSGLPMPSSADSSSVMRPMGVAVGTMSVRMCAGRLSAVSTSRDHVRLCASSICVVLAMEYSVCFSPERK